MKASTIISKVPPAVSFLTLSYASTHKCEWDNTSSCSAHKVPTSFPSIGGVVHFPTRKLFRQTLNLRVAKREVRTRYRSFKFDDFIKFNKIFDFFVCLFRNLDCFWKFFLWHVTFLLDSFSSNWTPDILLLLEIRSVVVLSYCRLWQLWIFMFYDAW